MRVPSLMGELRSHRPTDAAKKNLKRQEAFPGSFCKRNLLAIQKKLLEGFLTLSTSSPSLSTHSEESVDNHLVSRVKLTM